VAEDSSALGCYSVLSGKYSYRPFEGTTIFRNVGNSTYQSTRRNIPEHLNLHEHRCDNLKSRSSLAALTSLNQKLEAE
jgi:hypothetical protein